jgi:capsular polysaccharide biosynthesis protein
VVGAFNRRLPGGGDRRIPRRVYVTSLEAVRAEARDIQLTVGGPSELVRRSIPAGEPEGLAFWQGVVDHEFPQRSVLEIARGQLVGHYAASITPGGRLELETSPYFGIRRWQEHPIFLYPRLPTIETIEGTVVSLASHASTNNYYHAVMDAVPRWGIVREALPGLEPDAVVIGHRNGFGGQLAALLGLDRYRLLEPQKSLSIRAERLVVPALIDWESHAPPWVTAYLKRALPARNTADKPAKLYVTRGAVANTRRVVHERELMTELHKRGFTRIDPGAMSVQDQIDHFAAAEVVVAPHGAGLVNLNFASPGVRVLELFAADYMNPAFFSITSNIPGAHYRFLVSDGGDPARTASDMQALAQDITLAPDRILTALDQLLED